MFDLNELVGKTIQSVENLIDSQYPKSQGWLKMNFTDGSGIVIEGGGYVAYDEIDEYNASFIKISENLPSGIILIAKTAYDEIPNILSKDKFWELIKRLRPYIVEDEEILDIDNILEEYQNDEILSFVYQYKQLKNSLHQQFLYRYFSMFEIAGKIDEVAFEYIKEGIIFRGKECVATTLLNPDNFADFFVDKYECRDKLIGAGIDIEDLLGAYWNIGTEPKALLKERKLNRKEAKELFPKTAKLLEL